MGIKMLTYYSPLLKKCNFYAQNASILAKRHFIFTKNQTYSKLFLIFADDMDLLSSDILKMNFEQPEPMPGDLLLAEPLMTDISFQRAVIVLIEHSDEFGSMGFVTNRRANYSLNELVEEISVNEEIPLYIGGPVHHDRLYFLHTLGETIPESIAVGNGLYVSGNFNAVVEYINAGYPINGKIRFFLGYSGWEKEQLRKELDNFDWAVGKVTNAERILSTEEEDSWRAEVSMLDSRYLLWLNCPSSVILN